MGSRHTLISDQKDPRTMSGNAQSMVLHAGGSSNIAQHHYLHRPALPPLQRITSVSGLHLDLAALFVDEAERLVLVGIILAWRSDEQQGEEGGEADDGAQHDGEAIVESVGEDQVVGHGMGIGRRLHAAPTWESVAASCVTGMRRRDCGDGSRGGTETGRRPARSIRDP